MTKDVDSRNINCDCLTMDEMIFAATAAFAKDMSFEELEQSDYMRGKEHNTDDVWDFVEELREEGRAWFRENYKQYKMHPDL